MMPDLLLDDDPTRSLLPVGNKTKLNSLLDVLRRAGVCLDKTSCGIFPELSADIWALNIMIWNAYLANSAWMHQPNCEMEGQMFYRTAPPALFMALAAIPGWQLRAKAKFFMRHFNQPEIHTNEPHGYDNASNVFKEFVAFIEYFFTFSGGMAVAEAFMPTQGKNFECIEDYYTDWPLFLGQVLCGAAILTMMLPRLRHMYTHNASRYPRFEYWGNFIGSSLGKAVPILRSIYQEVVKSGRFTGKIVAYIGEILFGTTVSYISNRVLDGQFGERERHVMPIVNHDSVQFDSDSMCKTVSKMLGLIAILMGKSAYNGLAYYHAITEYGYEGNWTLILLLGLFSFFLLVVNFARTMAFY